MVTQKNKIEQFIENSEENNDTTLKVVFNKFEELSLQNAF